LIHSEQAERQTIRSRLSAKDYWNRRRDQPVCGPCPTGRTDLMTVPPPPQPGPRPTGDKPTDTQQGQPSGQVPMRANRRLGFSWVLFPLVVVIVLAVIFGLKFLLT
jgi:hypothetical protein